MRPELEQIQQIDYYLRGKMSSDEKSNFEQVIAQDHILSHEINMYKKIFQSIQVQGRSELIEELDRIHTKNFGKGKIATQNTFNGLTLILAISSAIFCVWWILAKVNVPQLPTNKKSSSLSKSNLVPIKEEKIEYLKESKHEIQNNNHHSKEESKAQIENDDFSYPIYLQQVWRAKGKMLMFSPTDSLYGFHLADSAFALYFLNVNLEDTVMRYGTMGWGIKDGYILFNPIEEEEKKDDFVNRGKEFYHGRKYIYRFDSKPKELIIIDDNGEEYVYNKWGKKTRYKDPK